MNRYRAGLVLLLLPILLWGGTAGARSAGPDGAGFFEETRERAETLVRDFVASFRDEESLSAGEEEDDDDQGERRIDRGILYQGRPALRLEVPLQQASGIRVRPLQRMAFTPELRAVAQVIDIVPLLSLRTRYFSTTAEADVHEVELRRWRQEIARLRRLHEEGGNVALRRLQQAESELRRLLVRREAARRRLRGLRDEALQLWGETITGWALAEDSRLFRRLITREDRLLLLLLHSDMSLPEMATTVFIGRSGQRLSARKAYRISPAPRTDPRLQGESWYFRTPGEGLRSGMRLQAWIPTGTPPVDGVRVPADAVVWYGGRPWIFLRVQPDLFVRHSLAGGHNLGTDWFVGEGLEPGQEIVTSGAQLLLSEEFNWQIPDEDEE